MDEFGRYFDLFLIHSLNNKFKMAATDGSFVFPAQVLIKDICGDP